MKTASKKTHACCLVCEGSGELTKEQHAHLRYFLDLAAWALEVKKHIESAEAEALGNLGMDESFFATIEGLTLPAKGSANFSMTDQDRDFLSGLNIAPE